MNLRDFFSRKLRDGREKEYKFDDFPDIDGAPATNNPVSSTPVQEKKVSEQDRVRTAEELADWSKVYFDHPAISDMIRHEVPDFRNVDDKQLYNAFKNVIDKYLPFQYKTSYCSELIRVITGRMFLHYGRVNCFYGDAGIEFTGEDCFRRDYIIALYKICEFCDVQFAEVFETIKNVEAYHVKGLETDDIYTLAWSFSDFTYLVENGSFKVIGGNEECVDEVKKIFRNNFGEFLISACADDITELFYFDIRYSSDDETWFMDSFFELIDSDDYLNDSKVMEIEAINELVRLYPQNVSDIYTYYFNMIIHRVSNISKPSELEDQFIDIVERIKDQAEYRSEEFHDIKANYLGYVLDVIDNFDGYVLNAFVDLLVNTLGVNKEDVEEAIIYYVDSFFDDYDKPFDYTSDFTWISKLLPNKTCFDIICYYKPSIVDMFR